MAVSLMGESVGEHERCCSGTWGNLMASVAGVCCQWVTHDALSVSSLAAQQLCTTARASSGRRFTWSALSVHCCEAGFMLYEVLYIAKRTC